MSARPMPPWYSPNSGLGAHSSELVRQAIQNTSECQTLRDTFKALGIQFYDHHAPGHANPEKEFDPKVLQKWMIENGFNLTIHATSGIMSGPIVYIFSCTSEEFTKEKVPSGSFLFSYNRETKTFTKHPTRTLTATE